MTTKFREALNMRNAPPKKVWKVKKWKLLKLLASLKFFKNEVLFSCDLEKWNSLPRPLHLWIQSDSFETIIGPPKIQKAALCDQSSIFRNFSKIRYASPHTLKNEILSQDIWTSKIIVISLGHSSDLQKCKNQLCATTLWFFGIFQKSGTLLLRLWKMRFCPRMGEKFANMYTDVKFCTGIEKNDGKIHLVTQNEVCGSHKGMKNVPKKICHEIRELKWF